MAFGSLGFRYVRLDMFYFDGSKVQVFTKGVFRFESQVKGLGLVDHSIQSAGSIVRHP